MKKAIILGVGVSLILSGNYVLAASNSPPSTYLPQQGGTQQGGTVSPTELSYDDWLKNLNGGLDGFENLLKGATGGVNGALDSLLGGFRGITTPLNNLFEDASALAGLVNRLINLPSQVSGWWNVMLGTVTGTVNQCSTPPRGFTQPFVYEPGWCMGSVGGGTGSTTDPSRDPSGDGSSETTTPGGGGGGLPPAPYVGKKPTMGTILTDSQGPAGIPDPSKIRALASAAVDSGSVFDLFESNSRLKAHYAGNAGERAAAALNSAGVVGQVGQAIMMAEKVGIDQAVTSSVASAQAAQKLDVTQDVMKQIAQMQGSQILLTGSLAVSSQGIRQDNAWTNLSLRNISRSLDESNRNRRIDKTIDSHKVLSVTSRLALY